MKKHLKVRTAQEEDFKEKRKTKKMKKVKRRKKKWKRNPSKR
jgi:hypothetical protein